MFKKNTAQAGFTLIELLITVAIMSIIIGGSIAGFITFQARQEVQTATKNLQQLVRTAQGKARVRETPTTCNSTGNRLQGYRLTIDTTNRNANIIALCGASTSSFTENSIVYTEKIPSTVTYSGPEDTNFFTLYRGVTFSSGSAPVTYSFTSNSDATNRYRFTVGSGGAVSEMEAF